jgi:hypothetical protein
MALNIGSKQVLIPLISEHDSGVNPASLNVRETFTVDMVKGDRRSDARSHLTSTNGSTTEFDKPVDNIGEEITLVSGLTFVHFAGVRSDNRTKLWCQV